jgi:hypothetical protein
LVIHSAPPITTGNFLLSHPITTRHLLGFSSSAYCSKTTCRSSGKRSRSRGAEGSTRLGSWAVSRRYRGARPTPLGSCSPRLHSSSSVLLSNFSVRHSLALRARDCLTEKLLGLLATRVVLCMVGPLLSRVIPVGSR